jgi:hypothetical protein
MATTGAPFFFVVAILAVLGTAAQINPVWLFGPHSPAISSNGPGGVLSLSSHPRYRGRARWRGELQTFPDDRAPGADCLCLSNLAERPSGR